MNNTIYILCKDSCEMIQFKSVKEMQKELEKIDVENREYFCWDFSGNVLKLGVKKGKDWLCVEFGSNEEKNELNKYITINCIDKFIDNVFPKI